METNAVVTTKIITRMTDIPQNEWENVFPNVAEGFLFFKTIGDTLTDQFKPYYILIYSNNRLVCVAPCFFMLYPLETTAEGFLKRILLKIKSAFPKFFRLRLFFCGCPSGKGRIGIAEPDNKEILKALVSTMHSIAKKEKASVLAFKDFGDECAQTLLPLQTMNFHKMQSYPSVKLNIHFPSFEAYLESLSRTSRKDLKRKFNNLAKLPPITLHVANSLGDFLDDAYELYRNTLQKSEVQFEILTKDFFRTISVYMPDKTNYFIWTINGKLAAFDLCIVHNNVLVDEYIGLDYALAYKYHLYYVTFRDIMMWCIKHGIHTYESGALNYDPKKRLDFTFVPQTIYVTHRNKFFNVMLKLLCLALQPENFDPVLKSLKKNHGKN